MGTVAVVAHGRKRLGGGLGALRRTLADAGVDDPMWFEVDKSRKAPKRARRAAEEGADTILVWGGDGTVQRCLDALAGTDVDVGILPAGTANLLANNLGIPIDLERAVDVGLHGTSRALDLGKVRGEHFAVMAGAGFDAGMIGDADRHLKDRFGRLSYVWTGARHLRDGRFHAQIEVDGQPWHEGPIGLALLGNVGSLFGGVTAFEDAEPDDGVLELGVVTAGSPLQWARALTRTAVGRAERSPFVRTTRGRKFSMTFDRAVPYELDGGERGTAKRMKVKVEPHAVRVRVPADAEPAA